MIPRPRSLASLGSALVLAGLVCGGIAVWIWMQSANAWRAHLEQAQRAGIQLYYALQDGSHPPPGITLTALAPGDQAAAQAGDFRRIAGTPPAPRITLVPILADPANPRRRAPLSLALLSPDLLYRVSDLQSRPDQPPADLLGQITRQIAQYCSDPVVLAHLDDRPWVKVDGNPIWGCRAAPPDRRLLAVVFAAIASAILITTILNLSGSFTDFAQALGRRRSVGGPDSYDTEGPEELRQIVDAVNSYLETERAALENRAAVLSGVSHDLGTPATRLRLRTALIEDPDLRSKLDADIDAMTHMIESVLTYTRAESSVEEPRKLSLTALVQTVVTEYQDLDRPVDLHPTEDVIVQGARSVFMSLQGQSVVTGDRDVIVMARPIALTRALNNLIDNALKYGRRADVRLRIDADHVTICVEDEGTDTRAEQLEGLRGPYQRGQNATASGGYGLGLTIVSTIAALHGGELWFEDGPKGLRACLRISRS